MSTRPELPPVPRAADPCRPLVVVCTGQSCSGLLTAAGTQALEVLRAAVHRTPGAVLVSTGCLRRCRPDGEQPLRAAVAMVGRLGPGSELVAGEFLVFAGVERLSTVRELAGWVSGTASGPEDPLATLPLGLRSTLIT